MYMEQAPPDAVQVRPSTPKNVADWARLALLKMIYGRDITTGELPKYGGIPYIPDRFMKQYVARVISWEEKTEMMAGFDLSQFKLFDVGDYDVIYFDHEISPDLVPRDTLKGKLTEVFRILARYFPENRIARKYHPHHNSDKAMITTGIILEDSIPAELLYSDKVKMYLGFWSTSLANVENGLVVSLIDLVPFSNNKLKNYLKGTLKQRQRSKILFPQSVDEFERILIELKEKETITNAK